MVVIVNGLPAVAKSTLARPLASALELPLLSKDTIKETHADVLGSDPPVGRTQREWNRQLGAAASRTMWAARHRSTFYESASPAGGLPRIPFMALRPTTTSGPRWCSTLNR